MSVTEILDQLDQLDTLAAEASKAPWGLVGGTHDREVIDDHGCHVATTGIVPDAALIVAAVNALPQLTTALRAVIYLAETWDALNLGTGLYPEDTAHRRAHEDRAEACAEDVRQAITAALSPAGSTLHARG